MGRKQELDSINNLIVTGFVPVVSPKGEALINKIVSYVLKHCPGVSAVEYDREFGFYRVTGKIMVFVDTIGQMAEVSIETDFKITSMFDRDVAELAAFFAAAKDHELNEYTRRAKIAGKANR